MKVTNQPFGCVTFSSLLKQNCRSVASAYLLHTALPKGVGLTETFFRKRESCARGAGGRKATKKRAETSTQVERKGSPGNVRMASKNIMKGHNNGLERAQLLVGAFGRDQKTIQ